MVALHLVPSGLVFRIFLLSVWDFSSTCFFYSCNLRIYELLSLGCLFALGFVLCCLWASGALP